MPTRKITSPAKIAGAIRSRILLGATAAALVVVPAGIAHADWYLTKSGAERAARQYVSTHYADTYASDLTTDCRPQGHSRANSRYVYHRWVCGWYDESDETVGTVLIIGSRTGRGDFYGQVITGAR
jgi:hypothetical protein